MSTIRSNSSGINSIEEIRDRITDATFLKVRPDAARDEVHTETKKLDRLDENSSIKYVIIHPVHTRTSSGNRQAEKLLYVCHAGVGSCIDNTSVRRWQKHANKNNVDIVLHNYPGYGDTTGRPTEDRICQDALQLLKEVHRQGQEVVLFGESIGCGPTMYLASSNETRNLGIKQMVLLSPFTSLLDLLVTLHPKYGLSAPSAYAKIITILEEAQVNLGHHKGKAREGYDSFRSLKLVEKLHVKDILVVHSKGNETIPVELAKELVTKILMVNSRRDGALKQDMVELMRKISTVNPVTDVQTLLQDVKRLKRRIAAADRKVRLVVMKYCSHSYTRQACDELIWEFIHGAKDSKLDRISKTVKCRKDPPRGSENRNQGPRTNISISNNAADAELAGHVNFYQGLAALH